MSSIIDDIKFQYRIGGIANKMIYWNVGVFLLSIPLFYQFKVGVFDYPSWLAVSSEPSVVVTRPWTVLTYAFFHFGFWHLFFNMMVLHFASRLFLTFFTQKQYLGLYLLSAVFSALIFITAFYFLEMSALMVGASASIIAILVATTTYQPLMEIRLLLIGNVKLWHITGVTLLLFLLQIGLANTGGHIAHFSGAFFGYIYIRLLQNGTDLSKPVNAVIDFFSHLFRPKKKTPFKKVHVTPKRPTEKKVESKIVIKDKTQQQIDEILDKISQSGYDSLTAEEKEFLFKAGK
ncbi:rhomboid family intramembrane serine protease [Flavobacterium sp. J49]|uniref:rhomboid family intramembrane serine protease n=1 Tax=Flavobacterium sp. J49 TaxID=2718534 RepID=UPI001593FF42|nr:rhomboid family intramembrane serine protease [Flavobacterium sp. J49]MBF6642454.1 rhomboid family intramembrane serine protease [Flavobacterium sp. J49]NIC03700.1 rhomboid family intramembrane serine protease [Flavobacterium sp. J49]